MPSPDKARTKLISSDGQPPNSCVISCLLPARPPLPILSTLPESYCTPKPAGGPQDVPCVSWWPPAVSWWGAVLRGASKQAERSAEDRERITKKRFVTNIEGKAETRENNSHSSCKASNSKIKLQTCVVNNMKTTLAFSDVSPQAKSLEMGAPAILRSPAAPPWRPAL
eukprot:1138272-Pelagomonas_calceolata.AAC.12